MQAETIELLSTKFTIEQALAVAEAIDMATANAQLVTVPIMDARFAEVNVRFAKVDARFDILEAKIDAKFERWSVRMIVAMIISQTALGPVGMAAFEAAHRLLSTLLH